MTFLLSILLFYQALLPEAPTRWVTDSTGFLSSAVNTAIDNQLRQFEKDTTAQVLVYIVPKVPNGTTLERYATQCFNKWGVGEKGTDNGLVLFVFADDRTVRIEVGLGLEKILTNQLAKDIIDQNFVPSMQVHDPDTAVRGSINRILSILRQ